MTPHPMRSQRSFALLLLRSLGLLVLLPLLLCQSLAGFSVEGRSIRNNEAPFIVRGVCYHPRPIGMGAATLGGLEGDLFTAEFGALHDRDLPLLRAMGANVVRVYGWRVGADHKAFLDKCYNGGVDPIYVIVNRWIWGGSDWTSEEAVGELCSQFVRLEEGLAQHPAVFAVALGNETNGEVPAAKTRANGLDPAYWAAMQRVAKAVKAENPRRLVTVPVCDAVGHVSLGEALVPAVDFWGVQAYRGDGFGGLFLEHKLQSAKPLVLTEFGMDAYDRVAGAEYPNNGYRVGQALGSLWREIGAAKELCAGGCVFEYLDEWAKTGGLQDHESGGVAHAVFPDGYMDDEWWGLFRASASPGGAPDRVEARAGVAVLGALWREAAAAEGRTEGARLVNISTRARVGAGMDNVVAGFIVSGTGMRLLLIRAAGPALGSLKDAAGNPVVPTAIEDPRLSIFDAKGTLVGANDDWGAAANAEQIRAVAAANTGLPFTAGSKDSAYLGLFMPGAYTVQVDVSSGTGGIVLVEAYEVK